MSFGIARTPMLAVLADAMAIPEARRSSFLGRFQHLQRLSLISGINPGRGKAAEYKAEQVVIIALAMQLLQLGLTPERTVKVVRSNHALILRTIAIAVRQSGAIAKPLIWFDPALLTSDGIDDAGDSADLTMDFGGYDRASQVFASFFNMGDLQRISFISVGNTITALVDAMEDLPSQSADHGCDLGIEFLDALWHRGKEIMAGFSDEMLTAVEDEWFSVRVASQLHPVRGRET